MVILTFRRVSARKTLLAAWFLACASLSAQPPQATELPGDVFSIRKTWTIGGEGNWDYLTLDPSALKLYVAHGQAVQVVDVSAGELAGEVTGFRDAHQIALDDQGQFAYVSDGPSNEVKVFDRRTLRIVATIATAKNPRGVVFEPVSKLVFAICPDTAPESRIPRFSSTGQRVYDPFVQSAITVIDSQTNKPLADLILPGKLGFALADGRGSVYLNVTDRNQIGHFDAAEIAPKLQDLAAFASRDREKAATANPVKPANAAPVARSLTLDWTETKRNAAPIPDPVHLFRLGRDCMSPRGLAIDSTNERLFTACENQKLQVLNAANGQVVATVPIGVGTDAIGYDANNGLIFTANGGAANGSSLGSVTIIRQHLSDSYAVIQELPTQARARTLAVNPENGEVYLVTNIQGFDLSKQGAGGETHKLPVVNATPVAGSFQVLVVGK